MKEKQIISIEVPKELTRKKQKNKVTLEDGEAILVSNEELLRYHITVGEAYSPAEWEELLQNIRLQRAYEKGLDFVLFKKNTRWELMEKLKANGFSTEEAEQALQRLEENDYVNDLRYTQSYVRQHIEDVYTTTEQMKQALLKKGVSHVIIETVLSDFEETEEDAMEKLKQYIYKKYDKLIQMGHIDYNKKMSIQQALYRKGYAPELIQRAVNEIWE